MSDSIIRLPSSITLATAPAVAKSLCAQALAIEGPVALDAVDLHEFDSSFWSVFAEIKRVTGKTVLLNNLPRQLQSLGQTYGIWAAEPERGAKVKHEANVKHEAKG